MFTQQYHTMVSKIVIYILATFEVPTIMLHYYKYIWL